MAVKVHARLTLTYPCVRPHTLVSTLVSVLTRVPSVRPLHGLQPSTEAEQEEDVFADIEDDFADLGTLIQGVGRALV